MISDLFRFTALLLVMAAIGCSSGPRWEPVVPETARAALVTTLDAWKAGRTADTLSQGSPPIVAQDMDWTTGSKLTSYKLLGEGLPQDANLRVEVELSLRDKSGRESTKRAIYIVGTAPKVTVFRAME